LDRLPLGKLLRVINREDAMVSRAVSRALPQIEKTVLAVSERLAKGGRLFYIGAGTSGRLGCLDASEMPPTYGVPRTLVQGIMAGGFSALTRSKEGAEDDGPAGVTDIARRKISAGDAVIGLSVSGRARYVQQALLEARRRGAFTACITCNENSPLVGQAVQPAKCKQARQPAPRYAEIAIVALTGPEVVTGSTRMKAGTAQKMILNMISTATMVRLGRVKGNRMVDLQIKCDKLRERARNLIMEETGADAAVALKALEKSGGSVRKAVAAIVDSR
jgi:N-acetylmuramic acid 6-phosphate etherase